MAAVIDAAPETPDSPSAPLMETTGTPRSPKTSRMASASARSRTTVPFAEANTAATSSAVQPASVIDRPAGAAAPSVAVLTDMDAAIAEVFAGALRRNGKFQVVERPKIEKAVSELNLSRTDIVNPAMGPRIGRVVGAEYLIFGSSQPFLGRLQINARLVRTETTEVLAAETVTGQVEEARSLAEQLARMLQP